MLSSIHRWSCFKERYNLFGHLGHLGHFVKCRPLLQMTREVTSNWEVIPKVICQMSKWPTFLSMQVIWSFRLLCKLSDQVNTSTGKFGQLLIQVTWVIWVIQVILVTWVILVIFSHFGNSSHFGEFSHLSNFSHFSHFGNLSHFSHFGNLSHFGHFRNCC